MENLAVEMLPEFLQNAVRKAINISDRAVSLYYSYNVCAVFIDENGNEFTGVNWEPANGDSTCAEVGAISEYLLSEKKPIKYIVTFGRPKEKQPREDVFCTPCGRCRQRIIDFAKPNTIMIGVNEAGTKVQKFELAELLPHSFNSGNL